MTYTIGMSTHRIRSGAIVLAPLILLGLFAGQVFACELSPRRYQAPKGDLQPPDTVPRTLPRSIPSVAKGARTEGEIVEGKKGFFTSRTSFDEYEAVVGLEADLPFGYKISDTFSYHDRQYPFYHKTRKEWHWLTPQRESTVVLTNKDGKVIASERKLCDTDGTLLEKTHQGSKFVAYTVLVMLSSVIGLDPPERSDIIDE